MLQGHDKCVKLLLSAKADPNVSNKFFEWPLVQAAFKRHWSIVLRLVNAGGHPSTCDHNKQYTALHLAAMEGLRPVVVALLSAKCDVNALNKFGETALILAGGCEVGGSDVVVRQLVEHKVRRGSGRWCVLSVVTGGLGRSECRGIYRAIDGF